MTESSQIAFEIIVAVEPNDIDELDHVNNTVYLRWVQEVATAHWQAIATAEEQAKVVWVVVRHEIDYKSAATLGDQVALRTWVGTASRLLFERHTEIIRVQDRRLLARARTLWCPIDARTRRPTRVSSTVRAQFSLGKI